MRIFVIARHHEAVKREGRVKFEAHNDQEVENVLPLKLNSQTSPRLKKDYMPER